MSYLGNAPARSFISFERQVFTIVNSQTAYALSHSVTNENDIRLVVNNVVQEPGSGKAYTATGTALTLSAALTNGTDEMYCVFLGRATATSAPGAGSIGTAQLASDSVTLAKMASGTDGNIISYDASGNPVAVATGNDGQVLTSAGAGAPPVFETPASAANTPSFLAYLSSSATQAQNADTKIAFNTEMYDNGGVYDNSSNYRFTPGVAGKFYIFCRVGAYAASRGYKQITSLKKNGTIIAQWSEEIDLTTSWTANFTRTQSVSVIDIADDNDYYEVYVLQKNASNGTVTIDYNANYPYSHFGAYKLIGV